MSGLLERLPHACDEVLLAVHAESCGDEVRNAADRAAIGCGFRRHPRLFDVVGYVEIETESGWRLLAYERLNAETRQRFPAAVLAAERNLHMDMTREAGRRSDAHLVRYRLASEHIGPAARVLDCASGLGYGSALLSREAPGRMVTGVDLSPWVVEYATTAFAREGRHSPAYRCGDATDLSAFADASMDAVVSFETIEHLLDPAPFMRHVHRVLAEDGLFVGSVPYRWIWDGDTGDYHHDWFDAEKTLALCGRFLSVEALWVQTAGGAGRLATQRVRGLHRHAAPGDEPEEDVEWVLVVARKRAALATAGRSWLMLASDVSELATMAAALPACGVDPAHVHVRGTASRWSERSERVMSEASQAFGFDYGGTLQIPAILASSAPPHEFDPADVDVERRAVDGLSARLLDECPVLQGLTGAGVIAPLSDDRPRQGLIHALAPSAVHFVAVGGEGEEPFELTSAVRAMSPVVDTCVGRAGGSQAWSSVSTAMRRLPSASRLMEAYDDSSSAIGTVVLSEPLDRNGWTAESVALTFLVHQVRMALRDRPGHVLVKPHSQDYERKVGALREALRPYDSRVRVLTGDEIHLPLEAFEPPHAGTMAVWGTSGAELARCAGWADVQLHCVDADYLEPALRMRVLRLARLHGHPVVALGVNDGLLTAVERQGLKREFLPAPAVRREAALMARLREADDMRRVARGRFERAAERLRDAPRWHELASELLERSGDRRIWIWGAGQGGRRVLASLRRLGVEPLGILDSHSSSEARDVDGVPVHGAADAAAASARAAGAIVLIASLHAPEILARIAADGDWRSTILPWVR